MRILFAGLLAVSLIVMFSPFGEAIKDKSLVLYFPFDEVEGGDTTKDLSSNEHHGTLMGNPEIVDGKVGKCLAFDSGKYVEVPYSKDFDITDEITVEAWVNLDRLPNAHSVFIGYRNDNTARLYGFGCGLTPENKIKVWTCCPDNDIIDNTTELKTGEWYHLAFTHTTADNGLVKIYVNGKVTHSQASQNPVAPPGKETILGIGCYISAGAKEPWFGLIDEVAVYSRALTDAEIQQDMREGIIAAVYPKGKLTTTWAAIKSDWE